MLRMLLGVVVPLALAGPAVAQEVTLSVAISMKDAVEELGRRFVASRPGVTLRYNFGSSGELQKQIEAGAPIDLFVSAAQRQMDELEQKRLVVPESRRAFARNVLTVVKPADSRLDLAKPGDLLDERVMRIAIGDPRTVPAGQYAEESLRAVGLWSRLQPKLVFAGNVRQTLDYVARGEVDAGFVYNTDAAIMLDRVTVAANVAVPRPVTYPIAVVAESRQQPLAAAFVEFVAGPEGRAVLERYGFGASVP